MFYLIRCMIKGETFGLLAPGHLTDNLPLFVLYLVLSRMRSTLTFQVAIMLIAMFCMVSSGCLLAMLIVSMPPSGHVA